jgi:hypothetical protein
VLALYLMADGLDDPELMELTHQALKGMLSLATKEGDGYKWPLFSSSKRLGERTAFRAQK